MLPNPCIVSVRQSLLVLLCVSLLACSAGLTPETSYLHSCSTLDFSGVLILLRAFFLVSLSCSLISDNHYPWLAGGRMYQLSSFYLISFIWPLLKSYFVLCRLTPSTEGILHDTFPNVVVTTPMASSSSLSSTALPYFLFSVFFHCVFLICFFPCFI